MPRKSQSSDPPQVRTAPPAVADSPRAPARSLGRRLAFATIALVIVLLLLEGLSNVLWLVVDIDGLEKDADPVVSLKEDTHCQYDEELGWTHIPGKHVQDFYEPGRGISINQTGLRGTQEINTPKPADTFRLVCLGDSFTLGYGVGDHETFPAQLEPMRPDLETVNMGQGGYSIGQCYLWYRRLSDQLDADAVVLAIIVADLQRLGIERTVNGYATPQFSLDGGGELVISNIPVPPRLEVGAGIVERHQVWSLVERRSGLVRTVSRLTGNLLSGEPDELEHFTVGVEVIQSLARFCRKRDQQLALVLLPTLQEYQSPELLQVYDAASAYLHEAAREVSVPFRDLSGAFLDTDSFDELFLEEEFHHYSPAGNRVVAEELNNWLPTVWEGYPESPAARE